MTRKPGVFRVVTSICICWGYAHTHTTHWQDRVFANGSRNRVLIPGRVITKAQNIVLDAYLLSPQHYKVWIKGKWSNIGKGVAPFPTLRCSSY